MNEIEKLYENAGLDNLWVERYKDGNGFEHKNWHPSYKVMIKYMMEKYGWTLMEAQNVAKKECRRELLPFTAEKQIELIKWLCKNKVDSIVVSCNDYGKYERWEILCNFSFALSDDFENVLCSFINTLWQDLTEEEKQQIKEILNGSKS